MKRSALTRSRPLRHRRLYGKGHVTTKELDGACRTVIFERDGHRCVHCNSRANLQWAHVFSRRYVSVRWDLRNSMTLCAGCHLWWHHQPTEAVTWWRLRVGERAYDLLRARMKSGGKIDRAGLLLWLQQELKRLQAA